MQTTYARKVQAIRWRGQQPRLYVSFPLGLAAAIGLEPGETVQWELLDRGELHLVRPTVPPTTTRRRASKGLVIPIIITDFRLNRPISEVIRGDRLNPSRASICGRRRGPRPARPGLGWITRPQRPPRGPARVVREA